MTPPLSLDLSKLRMLLGKAQETKPELEEHPVLRSNFGAMIMRLALEGHDSRPCVECGGEGFRILTESELHRWTRRLQNARDESERHSIRRELQTTTTCSTCHGSGVRHVARQATRVTTALSRCPKCSGSGEVTWEPTVPGVERGDPCPHCLGDGYYRAVTAAPTGGSRAPLAENMAEHELVARLDGRLRRAL